MIYFIRNNKVYSTLFLNPFVACVDDSIGRLFRLFVLWFVLTIDEVVASQVHDCTKHDVPAVLIIFVIIVFSAITCFGMRLFFFLLRHKVYYYKLNLDEKKVLKTW